MTRYSIPKSTDEAQADWGSFQKYFAHCTEGHGEDQIKYWVEADADLVKETLAAEKPAEEVLQYFTSLYPMTPKEVTAAGKADGWNERTVKAACAKLCKGSNPQLFETVKRNRINGRVYPQQAFTTDENKVEDIESEIYALIPLTGIRKTELDLKSKNDGMFTDSEIKSTVDGLIDQGKLAEFSGEGVYTSATYYVPIGQVQEYQISHPDAK